MRERVVTSSDRSCPAERGRAARAKTALALAAAAIIGALPLAFPGGDQAAAQGPPTTPNVVVLMADELTVEHLRVMEGLRGRIAQNGTTFDRFFATHPTCCPSRASYLTGQYPHNHGVLGNSGPDGGYQALDHTNTLPVWLQQAGYRTAHIGKYLNGYSNEPLDEIPPGWTEWYAAYKPGSNRMYKYTLNENGKAKEYGKNSSDYQTDVYTGKGVDFIKRSAPQPSPFFLSISFRAVHTERSGGGDNRNPRPAPRHLGDFADEPLPRPPSFDEDDVSDKPGGVSRLPKLDADEKKRIKNRYVSRLETLLAVDEAIAKIVATLKAQGELGNTLIVFTTDNGYFHGEHRISFGKSKVYEEATRVPLVMRGPGIPAGVHSGQLAANIDLAPTIVDVTGATPGRVMDGTSLRPLASQSCNGDRDILLETPRYAAIRTCDFVYADHGGERDELYDFPKDPFQLNNCLAAPACSQQNQDTFYAAKQVELSTRLAPLRTCAGPSCR